MSWMDSAARHPLGKLVQILSSLSKDLDKALESP